MGVLVFCYCSLNVNFVFFNDSSHITFKLRPIITLKCLWIFPFLYIVSITNAVLLAFLLFYFDTTSTSYVHTSVSLKAIMRYLKQTKLMLLISFCHLVMRVFYFLKGVVYKLYKVLDLISFFGIYVIL